jgi:hypothetical protein
MRVAPLLNGGIRLADDDLMPWRPSTQQRNARSVAQPGVAHRDDWSERVIPGIVRHVRVELRPTVAGARDLV